jgi:zinc D-Ala-D-Ala carboxypeptidase
MNLSEHFTLAEMTLSPTAIRKGISNTPNAQAIKNLKALCNNVLEPLRAHIGGPIKISSGYRSEGLNSLIGGSKSSQHKTGQAVDIDLKNKSAEAFKWIIANLDYDQIIWEFGNDSQPDWIHVSYSTKINRKIAMRAIKSNGKTKYVPYNG